MLNICSLKLLLQSLLCDLFLRNVFFTWYVLHNHLIIARSLQCLIPHHVSQVLLLQFLLLPFEKQGTLHSHLLDSLFSSFSFSNRLFELNESMASRLALLWEHLDCCRFYELVFIVILNFFCADVLVVAVVIMVVFIGHDLMTVFHVSF